MKGCLIKKNHDVELVFNNYPNPVRDKMLWLRKLIIDTAAETKDIQYLEETLKWGEPSYIAKKGSTLRIDWKTKTPGQYAMYFKCTSKLVPTFKKKFGDLFNYEGNRAIVFKMADEIPVIELKKCIVSTLRYHKVKHLQDLGI